MLALFRRDVVLAARAGGGAGVALVFFAAVVISIPFAVGPNAPLLAGIGSAILWTAILLAAMLGMDRMLLADHEDGSLDIMMLSEHPLAMLVLLKALAHWLVTILPLIIAAPLFALLLNMDGQSVAITLATLLLGSPALSFIGALGAAVTVSLPRGGLLLAVLVLPFCLPSLIFGVGAARQLAVGLSPMLPLAMLAAISLLLMVVGPLAAAAALKAGRE